MAHYERLANGKYAYTTTTQIVGGEDFTNPAHSIITGCLLSSDKTQCIIPSFGYFTNNNGARFTRGQTLGLGNNVSAGSADYSYMQVNVLNTVEIDNKIYYGIKIEEGSFLAAVLRNITSVNKSTKVGPTKITITYIAPNDNKISVTSFSTTNELSSTITSKSMGIAYICGGIPVNSIVLNVNLEQNV